MRYDPIRTASHGVPLRAQVGHLTGPIAELARAVGCPVVRLRAAIPEELLGGVSLAGSVGRSRGLSADSLQRTARHLARRLMSLTSMMDSMAPLLARQQAQARAPSSRALPAPVSQGVSRVLRALPSSFTSGRPRTCGPPAVRAFFLCRSTAFFQLCMAKVHTHMHAAYSAYCACCA